MFQHDWILSKMAEEKQRDLMRSLEHDRLVRLAQSGLSPRSRERGRSADVATGARQLLISLNGRLQAGTTLLYGTAQHVTYHALSKPHTHTRGG
jgi:hypothetical protein